MDFGRVVKDELSGSAAKSYVSGISRYHRVHGSPMLNAAAEHVKEELEQFGIDEVHIERYPADGRRKYWTCTSAMGWSVKGAELHLVEPSQRLLARFSEIPQSLHTYSKGTPPGGVTAELVDVGKGTSNSDYVGKKVRGKMVLATGRGRTVHLQAVVKRGAAGVVTDGLSYEFPGVRESTDIPDAHSYQGIWPTAKEAKSITFGFSLSRRQGNELRKLMAGGKRVILNAKVDAKLFGGSYSIVSATVRGSEKPDEELLLVAHLCHPKPSANDNASGSGLLIEIARTIASLVRSGKIERPKRTIRFLWVEETVGITAFLSKHPELYDRVIAGINMDMVGEDQVLCRSTLTMDCTPDSLPSYLNDFVFSMMARANAEYDPMVKLDMTSNFRIARSAHTGGSDHSELSEATVGIPSVGLTQWPDLYYHTSMDTIDKVSEESLRRVGWTVAVSALTLADAGEDTVHAISVLTSTEGMKRISAAVGKASDELLAAKGSGRAKGVKMDVGRLAMFHRMRVSRITERETRAVRSLRRLEAEAGADDFVERQAEAVAEHGSRELSRLNGIVDAVLDKAASARLGRIPLSKAEARAKDIAPTRLFKGTLDSEFMHEAFGEKRLEKYDEIEKRDSLFSKKMYDILNLMDGERDLCEITEIVSAQYTPTDMEDVLRFYLDLRHGRLVK